MKQTLKIDQRFGTQFEGNYEFQQITQGEYERILVSYMDTLGKVAKQDILKVNREMLWLSLTNQPPNNPLTKTLVIQGNLPHGLSIKFQEAYDKANGMTPDEQRFLSSPSDENNPTQNSPDSSSANASAGPNNNTIELAEKPSSNSP